MKPVEVIHSDVRLRENRVLMLRSESFAPADFVKNAISSFKESATEMKNYLLYLQGFKGDNKSLSAIRSTVHKADDLRGFNFVSNDGMLVPCPTGFKGNFLSYTMVLNENMTPILQNALKAINDFNIELSMFISNKEIKTSLRDNGSIIKAMRKDRTGFASAIAPYFSKGDNQRLKIGQMFDNTQGIVDSSKQALQAYERAYAADPRDIQNAVSMLTMKIDSIVAAAEGPEEIEVSQEAFLNLAEKAHEVGLQVELLGIHCAQCETAAVLAASILDRVIPLAK